jgi:hypothetical protein
MGGGRCNSSYRGHGEGCMSFSWSSLFGAGDLVDKASKGIDAMVLTDEEKIRYKLDFYKLIEPFKIAQRWIAMILVSSYVIVWLMCACLLFGSAFADLSPVLESGLSRAEHIKTVTESLASKNHEILSVPVALAVGFYFAGGMGNGWIEKFKGK